MQLKYFLTNVFNAESYSLVCRFPSASEATACAVSSRLPRVGWARGVHRTAVGDGAPEGHLRVHRPRRALRTSATARACAAAPGTAARCAADPSPGRRRGTRPRPCAPGPRARAARVPAPDLRARRGPRSEEHTSELQSPDHLVCRLLLEKKKKRHKASHRT